MLNLNLPFRCIFENMNAFQFPAIEETVSEATFISYSSLKLVPIKIKCRGYSID